MLRFPVLGSLAFASLVLLAGAAPNRSGLGQAPAVTVYKSPTCGCCKKWVALMQGAGFNLTVHDVDDVNPVKDQQHVPNDLRSCHTALVGGYVVEGHVPADLLQRMLKEHPKIAGLAVPGMVMGSPGMEGGEKQAYDVVSFDRDGKTSVYAKR